MKRQRDRDSSQIPGLKMRETELEEDPQNHSTDRKGERYMNYVEQKRGKVYCWKYSLEEKYQGFYDQILCVRKQT